MMKFSTLTISCSVLDAADYSYERRYVEKMISTWWNEKQDLIKILRKHPNWDEKAFAIKGAVDEVRESKEQSEYLVALKTMYRNCRANGMRLTDEQLDIVWDCVQYGSRDKHLKREC